MLVGAPRSATAWASVWLTTDKTLCYHDPLYEQTYDDLDWKISSRKIGIACTGAALFPKWLKPHKARKVIVHRDVKDINASIERVKLQPILSWQSRLDAITGMHIEFRELFEAPRRIYEYLLELPFDKERHALLCKLNIQRDLKFLNDDPHRGLSNGPYVLTPSSLPKGKTGTFK